MQDFSDTFDTIEAVLNDRIKERRKDLERWQRIKTEAVSEEDAVLRDISEMELALNVLRRVMGKPMLEEPFPSLDILRFQTQTIAQSALDIMEEKGGKAKIGEITDLLIRAGKLKSDRRISYGTVLRIVSRDARFVRLEPGTYGLASKGYLDQRG